MAGMAGMTRQAVAERLGISVASVRRMEGVELHPRVDAKGVHLFDPQEVEALATDRVATATTEPPTIAGEVAAAVFAALDEGESPARIVVALAVPPDVVRRLHAESKRLAALERRLLEAEAYASKTVEALNALTQFVSALPVPPSTSFTCDGCGASGCVTVPLSCGACGLRAV